jgi:hypothetical protein
MSQVVHTLHITITPEAGPTRKAVIEGFSEYLSLCPAAQSVIGCIHIQRRLHLENP